MRILPCKVQHICRCYADVMAYVVMREQRNWGEMKSNRARKQIKALWRGFIPTIPLGYQLNLFVFNIFGCTMYRLSCGYEWDLFTLLVTMWLTLPRPFAGRYHGSSRAWNSTVRWQSGWSAGPEMEPWVVGWGGGGVPLKGSQRGTLCLFLGPWQPSPKHVPHRNEHREAPPKNCLGKST